MPRTRKWIFALILWALAAAAVLAEPFRFVVLGDSRGSQNGVSPVYIRMAEEIGRENPAFVLNTGDVVSGSIFRSVLRKMLDAFKEASKPIKAPMYIAPGNHEVMGREANHRIFAEYFGPTYRSFDYGNSHFIVLDSEIPGQAGSITGPQLSWLKQDLARSQGAEHRFVVVHRPLFPVGLHKGSSLDRDPKKRDDLHALFKEYKVDMVFAGHEHLYDRSEKDGMIYYITGGAGAPLYATKAQGGFYHYLLVTVDGPRVDVKVVKFQ